MEFDDVDFVTLLGPDLSQTPDPDLAGNPSVNSSVSVRSLDASQIATQSTQLHETGVRLQPVSYAASPDLFSSLCSSTTNSEISFDSGTSGPSWYSVPDGVQVSNSHSCHPALGSNPETPTGKQCLQFVQDYPTPPARPFKLTQPLRWTEPIVLSLEVRERKRIDNPTPTIRFEILSRDVRNDRSSYLLAGSLPSASSSDIIVEPATCLNDPSNATVFWDAEATKIFRPSLDAGHQASLRSANAQAPAVSFTAAVEVSRSIPSGPAGRSSAFIPPMAPTIRRASKRKILPPSGDSELDKKRAASRASAAKRANLRDQLEMDLRQRIVELEEENRQLRKLNSALMVRVDNHTRHM